MTSASDRGDHPSLDNDDDGLKLLHEEIVAWFNANSWPVGQPTIGQSKELQKSLFDAGLAGLHWPVEYGGRGMGDAARVLFLAESRQRAFPSLLTIGLEFVGPTLLRYGTEDQKRRNLPPMLRGEEIWCELFSESGAGSDLAGLTTSANAVGEGWTVNGEKVWTSSAQNADFGLLLARTGHTQRHGGLSAFIVDMRDSGVAVFPLKQMNAENHFNRVTLNEVHVAADQLVGELERGWEVARTTLSLERAAIGASGGRRANVVRYPELVELWRACDPSHDVVTADRLVQCYIEERVLAMLTDRIRQDVEARLTPLTSLPKLALSALNRIAATLGGSIAGCSAIADVPIDDENYNRWAMAIVSAPSTSIAGGTNEILKNVLAERYLKLPKGA